MVLVGGVALNSVATGKILEENIFDKIWIQPAAGNAGGAVGAALTGWHIWMGKERNIKSNPDAMKGAYLGPEFNNRQIKNVARKYSAQYTHCLVLK